MSFFSYLILTAIAGYILKSSWDNKHKALASKVLELEIKVRQMMDVLPRVKPGEAPAAAPAPASQPVQPAAPPKPAEPPLPIVKTPAPPPPAPRPLPAVLKAAPTPPQQSPAGVFVPSARQKTWDWEKFAGEKLFSWVGGIALFLGSIFLVKYSVDQGWIGPLVRVLLGAAAGVTCLFLSLYLHQKNYAVTSHTLAAAGVAVLYADIFASLSVYHYIGTGAAFALLVLITVVAFLFSVRLDSLYVALLALVGGFLTPPLVSTGVDNPLGLFTYIALLNIGLAAVVARRPWHFLIGLAALCTVGMQAGWTLRFFEVGKLNTCLMIYAFFPLLFGGFFAAAEKKNRPSQWYENALGLLIAVALALPLYLYSFTEIALHPARVFFYMLAVDILTAALTVYRPKLQALHMAAGGLVFVSLMYWTGRYISPELLNWGLAAYLLFAGLHVFLPVVLQKRHPSSEPALWGYVYPLLMLVPVFFAIIKNVIPGMMLWPVLLMLDLLAVAGAFLAGFVWVIALALGMTVLTMAFWIVNMAVTDSLGGILVAMGFFSLAFFAAGFAAKKIMERNRTPSEDKSGGTAEVNAILTQYLPAASALLPFFLLCMVLSRAALANPSPVFGMALLFCACVGVLVYRQKEGTVALFALGGVTGLALIWQTVRFTPEATAITLAWYGLFFLAFMLFPFLFHDRLKDDKASWVASAAAGPAAFYMFYKATAASIGTSLIGIVPAAFAMVYLGGLFEVVRFKEDQMPRKKTLLALYGGVALFFISLIFPLQFDKQWLTLAWALEGAALVWLHRRVSHPGLKLWAAGLLAIVFARLCFNPAVFDYHPRSGTPIFNWYLYTYGIACLCFFLASYLWRPADQTIKGKTTVRSLLAGGGVVLAFLLMNIEIADYFSMGTTLTFQFSGGLAQDMTYTLGWFIFGFILMVVGMARGIKGARLGGMGLLAVAVGKLFLHDLVRLGELYRVGALVGGAGVLILASFLYQRHLKKEKKEEVVP